MKITPFAALLSAILLAPAGVAQNLLTNADFEGGLTGWTAFGNAQAQTNNPPAIVPLSGTGVAQLFGPFAGGFGVSGIFQEFPAAPGESFTIDAWSRHWDGDPLTGPGAPGSNWVVMKIAFFDAGNAEIAGAEGTILDGTSPTNTWIDNAPVTGIAPPGTVKVQALVLFLQPGADPGSVLVDDMEFTSAGVPPPPSGPVANLLNNEGFEAGLSDWSFFGNAFADAAEARTGTMSGKLFGTFSGGFNVSGMFQSVAAAPGQSFTLDAWSLHQSADPMIGPGAPGSNWMVMKIAFFDAGNVEITGFENTILDGTFPTDTWIDNAPVTGVAPAGTVSVQALILYLQPLFDGGAGFVDDVEFTTSAACELTVNGDFETGDFTGWQEFPSAPGNHSIVSPGSGSTFAANINNTTLASASLIKNANIGVGVVLPGETVMVSVDARGSTAIGGVAFVELFSEISGGGVSKSEILGGAPLALDPDPNTWTTFNFTTTLGPDVSGGITLQLAAITGGAPGSVANLFFDNASVTVIRSGAAWTNYGAGFAGTTGVPSLGLDAAPVIGSTVNIQMGNASGFNAAAALLFGDQQVAMAVPGGATLLNNALIALPVGPLSPGGGDTFALAIPDLGLLCGGEVYVQLIHSDFAPPGFIAFSRGLRIIFGE